jgi:hypothetical protein
LNVRKKLRKRYIYSIYEKKHENNISNGVAGHRPKVYPVYAASPVFGSVVNVCVAVCTTPDGIKKQNKRIRLQETMKFGNNDFQSLDFFCSNFGNNNLELWEWFPRSLEISRKLFPKFQITISKLRGKNFQLLEIC